MKLVSERAVQIFVVVFVDVVMFEVRRRAYIKTHNKKGL